MADTIYSLLYKDETVATITDARYTTPEFYGTAVFQDQDLCVQLNKVQDFELWSDDALPDDISDEDYYAAMKRQGLEPKYYDMWHSGAWTIRGSDGSISRSILTLDGDTIVWRPDPSS